MNKRNGISEVNALEAGHPKWELTMSFLPSKDEDYGSGQFDRTVVIAAGCIAPRRERNRTEMLSFFLTALRDLRPSPGPEPVDGERQGRAR